MPRANRYLMDGYTYHLTHRCHDQDYLLKFDKDRRGYRDWLVEGVARYKVPVLAYCIVSNHIHLVVKASSANDVADLMHLVAGATAREYNRRKDRSGAFWEDQYQCTAIENGRHLLNCIVYVHLNMVRAGLVKHPDEWRWSGHTEYTGERKRKLIIDTGQLLTCLEGMDLREFLSWYSRTIEERIHGAQITREPAWSESLAVGSLGFIEGMQERYTTRSQMEVIQLPEVAGEAAWAVREKNDPYFTKRGGEKRE